MDLTEIKAIVRIHCIDPTSITCVSFLPTVPHGQQIICTACAPKFSALLWPETPSAEATFTAVLMREFLYEDGTIHYFRIGQCERCGAVYWALAVDRRKWMNWMKWI
jgi:hypothetical protein